MTVRLTVDVRMANHSGIGTYVRNLVPLVLAARPDWDITLLGGPDRLTADGRHSLVETDIYSIREQFVIPAHVPRGTDLLWIPHYNVPLAWRGRLLVTIHDVLPLIDPAIQRHGARRAYARVMFGAVRRRASAILCNSAFTRSEFVRTVGAPRRSPVVTHLGVHAGWFTVPRTVPARPYLLYVGNVKPHKNLGTLVRAFRRVSGKIPHDLVLLGKREGFRTSAGNIEAEAQDLVAAGRLRFAGHVDQDVAYAAVGGATALVTTSLYEGFGLPALEAMAAGCPCLVSRAASLPEVCGDAALYCDPSDETDVAARLLEITGSVQLRETLAERGQARARSFTWQRCAEQTLDTIESTLVA